MFVFVCAYSWHKQKSIMEKLHRISRVFVCLFMLCSSSSFFVLCFFSHHFTASIMNATSAYCLNAHSIITLMNHRFSKQYEQWTANDRTNKKKPAEFMYLSYNMRKWANETYKHTLENQKQKIFLRYLLWIAVLIFHKYSRLLLKYIKRDLLLLLLVSMSTAHSLSLWHGIFQSLSSFHSFILCALVGHLLLFEWIYERSDGV